MPDLISNCADSYCSDDDYDDYDDYDEEDDVKIGPFPGPYYEAMAAKGFAKDKSLPTRKENKTAVTKSSVGTQHSATLCNMQEPHQDSKICIGKSRCESISR